MEEFNIREMTLLDYDNSINLWTNMAGIALSKADSKENIDNFLRRNPNLSYVIECGEEIVGTVMCGHDGRRGYIYHLAVTKEHRNKGLGYKLVDKCLTQLNQLGIEKCHSFVLKENELGLKFWEQIGFTKRNDIKSFSKDIS